VGGIPELIEDGVNGMLVDNDPAEVAAALRRIDERPLGLAARATVRKRFTEERMIESTLAAYHWLLDGGYWMGACRPGGC